MRWSATGENNAVVVAFGVLYTSSDGLRTGGSLP